MKQIYFGRTVIAALMMATLATFPLATVAQTRVNMPKNKYKVQDDVKLGRDATVEIERQFPVLNDPQADDYIQDVGNRLVSAIPSEFQQPGFRYTFKVVNARDINAFALPGGPMYVNRGMIEAARNEGEMAGVMAHEIAHVALRHATAQATKQGSIGNQLGVLGMILGGAILGGQTGAQLGMLGAQAWMTKYSREYETQADILGARILSNAGYDPRDLANMFQTIQRESGGGRAPEWLSSHPDPGNRFQNINREASLLRVSPNPIKLTRDFSLTQERLRSLPRARTMAELQQAYKRGQPAGRSTTSGGRYSANVAYPSMRTTSYSGGNWLRVDIPSNWRELPAENAVQFAPEGGYGNQGITHGAMIGLARTQSQDLASATREYTRSLLEGNSYLRQSGGFVRETLDGRQAYSVTLTGRSPITNRNEIVTVYTARLSSGDLLYVATVAPQTESARYDEAFRSMINSLQLND